MVEKKCRWSAHSTDRLGGEGIDDDTREENEKKKEGESGKKRMN